MPELPEVETVCRGLASALTGAVIEKLDQHRPDLRQPLPKNLPARLQGRKVLSIRRRAKYILMQLDHGETLLLHLGMSGRMVMTHHATGAERGKHDHLVFVFENGLRLSFNDARRFGLCDLIRDKDLADHKLLRSLGVEPLGDDLTPKLLAEKFKGKTASIKEALLDQCIIAGIGNIYACEALFYAGIKPQRKAGSLTKTELAKLVPAIRKVLNASLKAGGSSLRDYRKADGELGYFHHQFAVYGKTGEKCKNCICEPKKTGGVLRIPQAGRSSFYCGVKQK